MNDRSCTIVAEMLTAGAGVGDARARSGPDDADDERAHQRAAEGGDERRPTPSTASRAGAPAAAGARRPRAARARGRTRAAGPGGHGGHACSDAEYEAGGSPRHSSPSREATTRTPSGARGAVAGDEDRLAAPPRARPRRRARRCRRRASRPRPWRPGARARRGRSPGRAWPTPELGRDHDGVDERAQLRALEDVVQRDVPVARRRPAARRRRAGAPSTAGTSG